MIYIALAICTLAFALKLPKAIKGRGRASTVALGMFGLSVLLAIPSVYYFVDQLLGSINITNLLTRLAFLIAVALISVSMARVFSAYGIEYFAKSWPGITLIVASVATLFVSLYLMGGFSHSSVGLVDFSESPWQRVYVLAANIYPAVMAVALLVPIIRYITSATASLVPRIAYILIALGFVLLVLYTFVLFLDVLGVSGILRFSAGWLPILLFFAGIALISLHSFFDRRRNPGAQDRISEYPPASMKPRSTPPKS